VVADQDAGVVQWSFVPDEGEGVTEHVVVADGPAGELEKLPVLSPFTSHLCQKELQKRAFHSVF